jgi:hypothetical protein
MRTKTRKVNAVEVKFGKPYQDSRSNMTPDGPQWTVTQRVYIDGVLSATRYHRCDTEADANKLRRKLQRQRRAGAV